MLDSGRDVHLPECQPNETVPEACGQATSFRMSQQENDEPLLQRAQIYGPRNLHASPNPLRLPPHPRVLCSAHSRSVGLVDPGMDANPTVLTPLNCVNWVEIPGNLLVCAKVTSRGYNERFHYVPLHDPEGPGLISNVLGPNCLAYLALTFTSSS